MNTPHYTWAESPIHEEIRDAGLDPVNRTTNDTPTPSQIETNAAKRPNGLRACAIGILKNPDVVIASVIMNHAADKMEQLERELAAVTEQRDAVTLRLGNTQERMIDAERQRDRLAEALRELCIALLTDKSPDITDLLNKAGAAMAAVNYSTAKKSQP